MRINIYYFVVGMLSLLFCATHAINGYSAFLPLIDGAALELSIKITSLYIWHIISVENLVFGIVFLVMAFSKNPRYYRPAAWVVAAIIIARFLVILTSTMIRDLSAIKNMAMDSAAILIYVGLIIMGIRKEIRAGLT